jgi:hypothetical protein
MYQSLEPYKFEQCKSYFIILQTKACQYYQELKNISQLIFLIKAADFLKSQTVFCYFILRVFPVFLLQRNFVKKQAWGLYVSLLFVHAFWLGHKIVMVNIYSG